MSDKLLPCKLCGVDPRDINKYYCVCGTYGCDMHAKALEKETWNALMNTRALPEGYALAPLEPSKEMEDACYAAGVSPIYGKIAYKAMIAVEKGDR